MSENRRRFPGKVKVKQKPPRVAFSRFLRYYYLRLTRLEGHPIEIARGLAVGVFSGLFPWFGLQIATAIFLAIVVRGNKIAAAAATWISNPFTDVPIFLFNYKLGEFILGRGNPSGERELLESGGSWGKEILLTMTCGCLVSGTIGGIVTYFVSLQVLARGRTSRRSQREL